MKALDLSLIGFPATSATTPSEADTTSDADPELTRAIACLDFSRLEATLLDLLRLENPALDIETSLKLGVFVDKIASLRQPGIRNAHARLLYKLYCFEQNAIALLGEARTTETDNKLTLCGNYILSAILSSDRYIPTFIHCLYNLLSTPKESYLEAISKRYSVEAASAFRIYNAQFPDSPVQLRDFTIHSNLYLARNVLDIKPGQSQCRHFFPSQAERILKQRLANASNPKIMVSYLVKYLDFRWQRLGFYRVADDVNLLDIKHDEIAQYLQRFFGAPITQDDIKELFLYPVAIDEHEAHFSPETFKLCHGSEIYAEPFFTPARICNINWRFIYGLVLRHLIQTDEIDIDTTHLIRLNYLSFNDIYNTKAKYFFIDAKKLRQFKPSIYTSVFAFEDFASEFNTTPHIHQTLLAAKEQIYCPKLATRSFAHVLKGIILSGSFQQAIQFINSANAPFFLNKILYYELLGFIVRQVDHIDRTPKYAKFLRAISTFLRHLDCLNAIFNTPVDDGQHLKNWFLGLAPKAQLRKTLVPQVFFGNTLNLVKPTPINGPASSASRAPGPFLCYIRTLYDLNQIARADAILLGSKPTELIELLRQLFLSTRKPSISTHRQNQNQTDVFFFFRITAALHPALFCAWFMTHTRGDLDSHQALFKAFLVQTLADRPDLFNQILTYIFTYLATADTQIASVLFIKPETRHCSIFFSHLLRLRVVSRGREIIANALPTLIRAAKALLLSATFSIEEKHDFINEMLQSRYLLKHWTQQDPFDFLVTINQLYCKDGISFLLQAGQYLDSHLTWLIAMICSNSLVATRDFSQSIMAAKHDSVSHIDFLQKKGIPLSPEEVASRCRSHKTLERSKAAYFEKKTRLFSNGLERAGTGRRLHTPYIPDPKPRT